MRRVTVERQVDEMRARVGRAQEPSIRSDLIDEPLSNGRAIRTGQLALYLAEGLSFELWKRIGGQVSVVEKSSAWWIGDWLNYGEAHYGRRYTEATGITGLDYQTLRNYA